MLRVISKTLVRPRLRGFAAGVYVDNGGVIIAKDAYTLGMFKALQRVNNTYWGAFGKGARVGVDGQIGKNTFDSVVQIVGSMVSAAAKSKMSLPYLVPGSTRELAFDAEGYVRMLSDYGGVSFPSPSPDRLSTDYRVGPPPTSPEEIDYALSLHSKPSMMLWVGFGVVAIGAVLVLGGKKKKKKRLGSSRKNVEGRTRLVL